VFDELSALCVAHGIAQELLWAVPLRGRALVELGEIERGLEELGGGIEAHLSTRSTLLRPYYFVLYAGALLRARQFDKAERALVEAREVADATNQHAFDSEQRRLAAEVALARGDHRACEALYLEALAIARGQGALYLELRAARGYSSFLVGVGRGPEARQVLEICDRFTEGRSTADFVYAEALRSTL
jgi:predicted ATPase